MLDLAPEEVRADDACAEGARLGQEGIGWAEEAVADAANDAEANAVVVSVRMRGGLHA